MEPAARRRGHRRPRGRQHGLRRRRVPARRRAGPRGTRRARCRRPAPARAFDPGTDGPPFHLLLDAGTLYAAGAFTEVGDQARAGLAAVDATTGALRAWNPAPSGGDVLALASGPGRVYVAGDFASIGGAVRKGIAAVDTDTGAALAVESRPERQHRLRPRGQRLDGVRERLLHGDRRQCCATVSRRWTRTTATATAWAPLVGGGGVAYDLAVVGSNVFVGGSFTSLGGQPRNRLGALDAATAAVTTWTPSPGNVRIHDLATTGLRVFAGGESPTFSRVQRPGAAAGQRHRAAISGTPAIGAQLSCSEGVWQFGPATYAFAWLRDGAAIDGESAATYVVTLDDAGHGLTCRVTATNTFGSTPADSASAAVPPPVPPANTALPAISGTAARRRDADLRAGHLGQRADPLRVPLGPRRQRPRRRHGVLLRGRRGRCRRLPSPAA